MTRAFDTVQARKDYDAARARYTAAIRPVVLDPALSKTATLLALVDCVACISAGAVHFGGLPEHELVLRFKRSLAEAVQVSKEQDGAH